MKKVKCWECNKNEVYDLSGRCVSCNYRNLLLNSIKLK